MKRNVVLLIDADGDTANAVQEIASQRSLDVQHARTSRDLFQMLPGGLANVAVVVLDVDPDIHGMAVLEALDAWSPGPPVIVLSSFEETYVRAITLSRGARACFGKPVTIERLRKAIEELADEAHEGAGCRCDVWGHSCPGCTRSQEMSDTRELVVASEKF